MLSHVLRTIRRHKLLVGPQANRLLCAVSGGPDSMALLACLWELAPRLGLHLEVATVDHGLRAAAAAELALVAERAEELHLPWHGLHVDVAAARGAGARSSRGGQGGIQEVARRLRLEALTDLAQRRDLGRVALGHNADDQTETILFRILRGTGARGLAGIPYRRGCLVRPLLDVPRAEILAYLRRRSLPYVTDPSNADLRYARARIRHRILPLLRQENPKVDRALRSLAQVAAREFQTEGPGADELRDVIHVPSSQAAEIAAAARDGKGTRLFDLPGGRRVIVTYGHVTVSRRVAADPPSNEGGTPGPVLLDGPGTYSLGAHAPVQLQVRQMERLQGEDVQHVQDDQWGWFDGDLLAWPLSLRSRREGDRMFPRGGRGTRKLSDLMIDAKIPRLERASLPVVTGADGQVLFVPGLRPSQSACPSSGTLRRIGLAVLPKPDHDASVDRSIARGNTERYPYHYGLPGYRDKAIDGSAHGKQPCVPEAQGGERCDGRGPGEGQGDDR